MSKHNAKLVSSLVASIAIGIAGAAATAAAAPLHTQVYTASPQGFLVDSTLITGDHDAILVDAQLDLADAHRLVGMILDSKKHLTTVYITHFHPDHYFGLTVIKQAFPDVKIVALPAAVAEIKQTYKAKLAQWSPMFGANLVTQPILPSALTTPTLTLDGQTIEVHGGVQADGVDNSYLWIPSIKTAIVGDIVYRGVHPWTADTTPDQRVAWQHTIDTVAALAPTTVIAGHKDPKLDDSPAGLAQTKAYLIAFDRARAESTTAADLERKMTAVYPDLQLAMILTFGAGAAFAAHK